MSNIDFSQLITQQTKADQSAAAHAEETKAECRRRILAQFPFAAQQNIAQAVTFYAIDALDGRLHAKDMPAANLSKADFAIAAQGQAWIARMQAACRALSNDRGADPQADAAWPAIPKDVAQLIARF